MRLEDYEEELEKELEDYSDDEERKASIFNDRVCKVIVVVSLAFIVAVLGFIAFMPTSENDDGTPPPTEGYISFWLYCDDIYVCPFNVYVKGEGVPDPNFLGWDWTQCSDDHVDCYYTGSYDFFGGTLMLDPGSSFMMDVTLPFGTYDYELKIAQTVKKSGTVYLSEHDHKEIVSYHYYG